MSLGTGLIIGGLGFAIFSAILWWLMAVEMEKAVWFYGTMFFASISTLLSFYLIGRGIKKQAGYD